MSSQNNYEGENVLVKTIIRNSQPEFEYEWFPNKVKFPIIKGDAYVIGNAPSRRSVDLFRLQQKGLIYGCNALYRDFTPDYLITVDSTITDEVVHSGYASKHVVYSTARNILRHDVLNLIPNILSGCNAGALAAHIAAFHGHKKIHMVGFDYDPEADTIPNIYLDTPGYAKSTDNAYPKDWPTQFQKVFNIHQDVEFIFE